MALVTPFHLILHKATLGRFQRRTTQPYMATPKKQAGQGRERRAIPVQGRERAQKEDLAGRTFFRFPRDQRTCSCYFYRLIDWSGALTFQRLIFSGGPLNKRGSILLGKFLLPDLTHTRTRSSIWSRRGN